MPATVIGSVCVVSSIFWDCEDPEKAPLAVHQSLSDRALICSLDVVVRSVVKCHPTALPIVH